MKMMKRLLSILFAVIIAAQLFSCNKKNDTLINNDDENVESENFVVGFDAEYPPYGYLSDDGKTYTGFDLDLAREFCKRNNLNFIAQPIDWDTKDVELNSGAIDCIWNGFTIDGRENDYTWTVPYIDNSIVLIVMNDSDIKNKKDLAGKNVMVQAGSSGLIALESDENVEFTNSFNSLDQVAEYNTAFMNLESGATDCIAVDIGVAKYQLNNNKGKFRQLDETVNSEKYGVGFKLGNDALRDKVEECMFDMYKDGTMQEIANKYSDYALSDTICIGDYIK